MNASRSWSGSEILLLCLAIIPIALWEAYVVTILWAWFLVPMGLPELSLLAAWALKTMTHSSAFTKKDNKDISPWRMLTFAFGGPACVLGICWIVKAVLL